MKIAKTAEGSLNPDLKENAEEIEALFLVQSNLHLEPSMQNCTADAVGSELAVDTASESVVVIVLEQAFSVREFPVFVLVVFVVVYA